jgi:tetratricopeptide (TPR) repeat protein
MRKISTWVVALVLIVSNLSGQDFRRQYRAAKEFFEEKKYNFAMDAFKPLMVYDKENPYAQHASFYYAVSAYHQYYYTVAKESLIQTKKLYPDWDQLDEVNYWLAAVYFQQGEYFQALRMLYTMRSPRDLASIESMKKNYLVKIYDEEVIRLLMEEFPGEVFLLKRLINRKIAKGEFERAKELIKSNGLDTAEFYIPEMKPVFKEKYRVAALFPFLSQELDPSPGAKRNQSTLDLYQGMKFAIDSLEKLEIKIELAAYDTERQSETVAQLMSMKEMKSADVLVGPLFMDEMPVVSEFSKGNKIPMVNPISSNADYVVDNPNALLLQPDFARLGAASAEALAKRKIKRPCVVVYGESPKDTTMAFSFLRRAEELGIKVAFTKEIEKESSSEVYSILANATKFDKYRNPIEFTLKRDSIGSVFVASDDELIFTKVISSIDRRADSVIIVGQDTWIDKPSMDLDKFERLHIMMTSPGYTDVFSGAYQNFRRRYAGAYGVMPSPLTKVGFECMMMIGKGLKEYGSGFISGFQTAGEVPGALGRVYRYEESQCNKEVPFVIFENGELRRLDD